jgi:hypothetical protein
MSEGAKIKGYVEEAGKLWATNQELVQSRQFYCLWEDAAQPLPFGVPAKGLQLGRQQLIAAGKDERVAHFFWHEDEHCAALRVDDDDETQLILLRIVDGFLQVTAEKPEAHNEDDRSYGERVELMAEIVAQLRESYPGLDLKHVQNAMILEALETQRERYPAELIRSMEKSSARTRMALVAKVLADMAADEFSPQLSLNLGPPPAQELLKDAAGEASGNGAALVPAELPGATRWSLLRSMNLLLATAQKLLAAEERFVMNFSGAEQLSPLTDAGSCVLRLPLRNEGGMPLREGSRLVVFPCEQAQLILADFTLDLLDGDEIIGTLSWGDPQQTRPVDGQLCAGLRRTPQAYVTRSLQELQRLLLADAVPEQAALRGALGLNAVPYLYRPGPPLGDLDVWQRRAVAACLDPLHRVVLVQGPPGTGKTCVIEKMLRELCRQPQRVLICAPSNAAVDNLCRRLLDLPLLRHGSSRDAVQEDIAEQCWHGDEAAQALFATKAAATDCALHAGTPIGLLRSPLLSEDLNRNGLFDVMVFDEAGMGGAAETLLCLCLTRRALFFGDPQQLPPFPLPQEIWDEIAAEKRALTREERVFIGGSFLGWLQDYRCFPTLLLRNSYRCQNPRLMRFASHLFYNAQVQAAPTAEYYQLSYKERLQRYPASTLRFVSTSRLPAARRREQLLTTGQPGIENLLEAEICAALLRDYCRRYPLNEITVITPYRRQLRLLRKILAAAAPPDLAAADWEQFLQQRVSTVDSFQGGESDVVIISYVRSGGRGVGFVDDPNRVNVTHTRSRREMIVVGDADFLAKKAQSRIFVRMLRAIARDGVVEELNESTLKKLLRNGSNGSNAATTSAPAGGESQLSLGF